MSQDLDKPLFYKRQNGSSRPQLPLSTPGLTSSERFGGSFESAGLSYAASQKKLPDVTLNKMMTKLPFGVRENVSSVVQLALSSSDMTQKQLETYNVELNLLRAQLKKKTIEHENTSKRCEIYLSRMQLMEEKLAGLQDSIDLKQKYSIRNKRAVNRLSNTNRMLIDAFEALQEKPPNSTLENFTLACNSEDRGEADLALGASENEGQNKVLNDTSPLAIKRNLPASQNDKLRESLLRIAREHYRSVKATESLEVRLDELRNSLKAAEKRNRMLENEINSYRELDDGNNAATKGTGTAQGNQTILKESNAPKVKTIKENLEFIDSRLKALLQRHALDPMDGITQMRRILACFSSVPRSLHLLEVSFHLCSKSTCKLFDVEAICISLVQPGGEAVLKYSFQPYEVELLPTTGTKSLVDEVLRSGNAIRVNSFKDGKCPSFNQEIDGCKNIHVKRMLSVPILDRARKKISGVVQMYNKTHGNGTFTEVDEVFALIFADHAAVFLASSMLYKNVAESAELLHALLDASTALFAAVPDPNSIAAQKSFSIEDLLTTLENVARDALKCTRCKAFLMSEFAGAGYNSGHMITFDRPHIGSKVTYTSVRTKRVLSQRSGLAGKAAQTKLVSVVDLVDADSTYNPEVDLDPVEEPLVTVPIVDLNGSVLACLQLVRGPHSPKLGGRPAAPIVPHSGGNTPTTGSAAAFVDNEALSFEQAVSWLAHQLANPMAYLVSFIGRSAARPSSTPKQIKVGEWVSPSSLSLLPRQFFGNEKNEFTVTAGDFVAQGLETTGAGEVDPTSMEYSPKGAYVGSPFKKTTFKVVSYYSEDTDESQLGDLKPIGGDVGDDFNNEEEEPVKEKPLTREEFNKMEEQLLSAQERISELTSMVEKSNEKESQLQKELETATSSLSQSRIEFEKTNDENMKEISSIREELNQLRQKYDILSVQLDHTHHDLALKQQVDIDKSAEIDALHKELANSKAREIRVQNQLEEHMKKLQASEDLNAEHVKEIDFLREELMSGTDNSDKNVNNANNSVTMNADAHHQHKRGESHHNVAKEKLQLDSKLSDSHIEVGESKGSANELARKKHSQEGYQMAPSSHDAVSAGNHPQLTLSTEDEDEATVSKLKEGSRVPSMTPARTPSSHGVSAAPAAGSGSEAPSRLPTPSAKQVLSAVSSGGAPAQCDWVEIRDGVNPVYYYNHVTCESSWTPPENFQPASAATNDGKEDLYYAAESNVPESPAVVRQGDWIQTYDDAGNTYWFNEKTGASSWELPSQEVEQTTEEAYFPHVSATAGGYTIEL